MKTPAPLLALGLAGCLGAWLGCEYALPLWIYPAVFLALALGALKFSGMTGTVAAWLAGALALMFYAEARTHYFPASHLVRAETAPRMARFKIRALEDATLTVNARGVTRLEFLAEALELSDSAAPAPVSGKLRALVREPRTLAVDYGDELLAAGYLQPIAPPTEPGEFDAQNFYRARGVFHQFDADPAQTTKLSGSGGNWPRRLAFALRRHMRETLRLGLETAPETAALVTGILFADKGAVPDDIKENFRVTGTQHIFAVSGLHVATVLAVLMAALDLTGVPRWRWAWTLLPALLVFCLATGMRPSAFRAFVMIALVAGGWLLLRPANVFNLLGAAALALLVWEPRQVLDTGFQLSFCVVLGMAVAGKFLYQIFYAPLRPDPWIPRRLLTGPRLAADRAARGLCALAATSVAAWLASEPILMYHLHLVSPVAPLANMAVVPLAGLVVTVAALSVLAGWACQWLPLLLNQVNWLALKVMVWCAGFFAQLPGSHFYVSLSDVPRDTARFTFCAQRELPPALLQCGGGAWLIGSGAESLWRYQLNPYRKQLGLNSLDGVILPRGGALAAGAAASVSGALPVGFWAVSGLDKKTPAEFPRQFWRRGDSFLFGEKLSVSVLHPAGDEQFNNQHDAGLALRFELAGGVLLYAGNLSKSVETALLASGQNLRADCLVQGPNARQNLSRDWLLAVRPRHIIRPLRGYGADASLTREFWQTVEELGAQVWLMDDTGSLTVELGPAGCAVRKFR